jgi:hypothetical protein
MADVDHLARQTVAMVTSLARRGVMLAAGVALITLLVGGLSYLTGLAALEGSAAEAWAIIGGAMLIVAVGAPTLAWWRLSRVTKDVAGLVGEVGRLISIDPGAQRVVIETVTVDRPDATGATTVPAIVETRQFGRLHQATTAANLVGLSGALRAVISFPWLLLIAVVLMLVFAVLGFLFVIAWIL